MKKIKKHIKKLQFVKVYISDKEERLLTHFEGVIFGQNDDFILMCDLSDFNYDGFVVLRKADISEIKRSENEKFFNQILKEEKIIKEIRRRNEDLGFILGDLEQMFRQLKKMGIAAIVECLYDTEESFQIGPIVKVKGKKLKMDYFNSCGEFNFEPVSVRYKNITFFRFDSPYANLFFKYADRPQEEEEIIVTKEKEKTKKSQKKAKVKAELKTEKISKKDSKKEKPSKKKNSTVSKKDKSKKVSEKKPKKQKKTVSSKKVKAKKTPEIPKLEKEKSPKKEEKKTKVYKRPKQTERLLLVV